MKTSVIGIVFNKNKDQILLVKRSDVPIWVFPGGGVDPGETPEDAVVREIQEETGLQTTILRKVGVYKPVNKLAFLTYVFECTSVNGSLTKSFETREVGFYPLNKPPKPFFFIHEDWLNDALLNQSTIIEKHLTNISYWALFKYFCRHPFQVFRFTLSCMGIPFNSQ